MKVKNVLFILCIITAVFACANCNGGSSTSGGDITINVKYTGGTGTGYQFMACAYSSQAAWDGKSPDCGCTSTTTPPTVDGNATAKAITLTMKKDSCYILGYIDKDKGVDATNTEWDTTYPDVNLCKTGTSCASDQNLTRACGMHIIGWKDPYTLYNDKNASQTGQYTLVNVGQTINMTFDNSKLYNCKCMSAAICH